MAPSTISAPAAALLLALPASAQLVSGELVERAAELGLIHHTSTGLDRVGPLLDMADWSQQGVGVGDLDGDGDLDVVAAGRLAGNHAFRNDGARFADVTASSGVQAATLDSSVALADFDRDGDLDVHFGSLGRGEGVIPGQDRLLANDGSFVFEDVTARAGTRGNGQTIAALWFDLNLDGWPDLYVSSFHGTPNALYENLADGGFRDVAAILGADLGGSTHVSAAADLDLDGVPDLMTGSDWNLSNNAGFDPNPDDTLLVGLPGGGFSNQSRPSQFHALPVGTYTEIASTTMGITLGDVDYDGLLDVYKTEYGPSFLLLNNGWPGTAQPYQHVESFYGVKDQLVPNPLLPGKLGPAVGWGCAFLHLDADPWLDLAKVNGHVAGGDPIQQPNRMWLGLGPSQSHIFSNQAAPLGFDGPYDDRGLAVVDLDGDGDVDLLVTPAAGPLRYYENRIDPGDGDWFSVTVEGGTSSPGGEGVLASWTDAAGYLHVRPIGGDAPTASQRELRAVFGMGTAPAAEVSVRTPAGMVLTTTAARGERLRVVEPKLVALSATSQPVGAGGPPIVVTAFAHDEQGQPLDGDAAVAILVPGLAPLGPVEHVGGNEFRRAFAPSDQVGAYRVQVAFDDFAPLVRPRLGLVGPLDPGRSTLDVTPSAVRAGSADPCALVFVPRDEVGQLLGPGHALSVRLLPSGQVVPLADAGDGSYTADLSAPATPGWVSAQVEASPGAGFTNGFTRVLQAAGPPVASSTLVYLEFTNPDFSQEMHRQDIEFVARDAAGRRLGPEADVEVELELQPQSSPVVLLDQPSPRARDDGAVFLVLERPEDSGLGTAMGVLRVRVDGVEILAQPFAF